MFIPGHECQLNARGLMQGSRTQKKYTAAFQHYRGIRALGRDPRAWEEGSKCLGMVHQSSSECLGALQMIQFQQLARFLI